MKIQKSKEISEARGMYNVAVMKYICLFEEKYNLEFFRWENRVGEVAIFSDSVKDFSYLRFPFDKIRMKIDYTRNK